MTPLYRYGLLAWVWRVLIALALGGGGLVLVAAVRLGEPALLAVATPVLLPAIFFGLALVTRADLLDDGRLRVWTLIGWRRRVAPGRLGKPLVRTQATGEVAPIYAPRMWVAVRGGVPLYFDLFATIPDRRSFVATFRVPPHVVPRRGRRAADVEGPP